MLRPYNKWRLQVMPDALSLLLMAGVRVGFHRVQPRQAPGEDRQAAAGWHVMDPNMCSSLCHHDYFQDMHLPQEGSHLSNACCLLALCLKDRLLHKLW